MFDLGIGEKLVLEAGLLRHHLDHHFHGVALLIHGRVCLHFRHGFGSLALRFVQVFGNLPLV